MKDKWKSIATCGIWIGVGIACAFCPERGGEIAGSGAIATVLMWIFA